MTRNDRTPTIFFDLDETLYPRGCGLMQAIGQRIHAYMVERLGFSEREAQVWRKRYRQAYGTTLRGLQEEYQINPGPYLAYVYELRLADFIDRNPALDRMLARLPQQKVVFTNADSTHAERVLGRLGIGHHFAAIVDIVANDFVCKPDPATYRNALALAGADPQRSVLVEDNTRNLAPAKRLGLATILVDSEPDEAVDVSVASILEVGPAIERLLAGTTKRPRGDEM